MDLPPRELYPDYYDVIKVPMCLRLIQQKIETGAYSRWNSFEEDMLVMFANARQYNLPDSQVCQDAATLEVAYRQYAEKLPASVRSEDMLGAWELLCKATDDSGRAVATEFMELPARELPSREVPARPAAGAGATPRAVPPRPVPARRPV